MTVYIDLLFLSNLIINSMLVLWSGIIFRERMTAARALMGGAILSCYSVIMFFPRAGPLLTVSGKILCTALFVLLFYRPKTPIALIRRTAVFFALSLIVCGAAFAAAACLPGTVISNGVPCFDLSLKKLLTASAAAFVMIKLTADIYTRNLSRGIVCMTIFSGGKKTRARVLIDTGCELFEPLGGRPVLLIRGKPFKSGVPIALGTVTGGGVVFAKKADGIICRDKEFGIDAGRCLVAFTEAEFTGDGLYNGVAPPEAFYFKHKKILLGGMRMKGLTDKIQAALGRALVKLARLKKGRVHYIGGSDTLPPPLERDEEQIWLARLGDPDFAEEARQLLIERNLRLVVYIAKRFDSTGIGIEDLISIGTIGLIKAINTFRPEKKIKLATYASRCIENEILMYLRKNSNVKTEVSIDEPLNVDWDGKELLLSDILGTDGDVTQKNIEDETDRKLLNIALSRLGVRERSIVEMRFGIGRDGDEMTQKEVADLLGISQSYISRLEKRIIKRLRKDMTKMLTS